MGEAEVKLSNDEIKRYSRHLILPEVGKKGQEKLKAAKVLIVGTGGLGSPASLYLTSVGVGTIGLVDFDTVDYSNLHRQVVHPTANVGKRKVISAAETLSAVNPEINIETYDEMFTSKNAMGIAEKYDIIIDGTDNYPTRYLVNDVCVLLKKKNCYGSIFRFEGQASVFDPENGPCYRCLYPEPPPPGLVPSCAEGGVLGVLPGLIGMIQATEAIKIIIGIGTTLAGRLLLYDALDMKFRELKLCKHEDCPICGTNPTIHELIDYEQFCGLNLGQESEGEADAKGASEAEGMGEEEITVKELKERLDRGEKIEIIDVRETHEWDICHIENSRLFPLGQTDTVTAEELDPENEYILHCHHGMRSQKALNILKEKGFRKLKNLTGGIDAWAEEIEPEMPRY